MSRSELHNWECAIERLSGDNVDKMLAIAQDIYNTAFVRGKNYMSLEQQPCEDALSPTVEPVGLEEAKKLIYQEWKSKVAEDNPNQRLLVAYQIAMKALEQEPCEDAISRQAVLDQLDQAYNLIDAEQKIKELKSVIPQQKVGRWINAYPDIEPIPMFMYGICSNCGFEQGISAKLNYCSNCGAKMEGEYD